MAQRATLYLGTKTGFNRYDEYEILSLSYSFNQALILGPVHGIGMPRIMDNLARMMSWRNGEVTGGDIKVTIATLPDSNTIFHRWMFSRWRQMSGRIVVEMNAPKTERQFLTIEFQNGYCTSLEDKFDSQKGEVMTTQITISCQSITIGKNIPAVWPAFI